MSILSDFEDRVASAVEGLFAGAFRSPVQPAEVAKALGRAMDDGRMVGVGKVYAPVAYTVALSPADTDNLARFASVLAGELSTYVTERAREAGYHLASKVTVCFIEHDDLRIGRFRVSAEHAPAEGAVTEPQAVSLDASVAGVYDYERDLFGDDEAEALSAGIDTVTIGETDHDVALRGDRVVFGRLQDCDVCLADANVSRHHAELLLIEGDWYLQDLESTNGTMLNGEPVARARLRDGDVVEIGVTRLTYHRARS
ncbi:MAG: DUF3662 and FHA domain-containing protein [Coriobacteriia bacterium]|nr:DUF3662 and FHA domain-containing protein [Coriobacteriia bacterium]